MPLYQLDTENADRDLTSQVTVLTHTPNTTKATLCQGLVMFGDGVNNLDGTGGDFELTITVGGQTVQPDPQTITFSTAARCGVWTTIFPVPANTEVILKAKSPNAGDSVVDVTAYLYEVTYALPDVAVGESGGIASAAKLLAYVRLLARADYAISQDASTELTEINANVASGAGSYLNTTDSVEAIRNRGDLAWLTGGSGGATKSYTTEAWTRTVGDNDGGAGSDTATVNGTYFATGEVNSGTLLEVAAVFTGTAGEVALELDFWGFYVGGGVRIRTEVTQSADMRSSLSTIPIAPKDDGGRHGGW